GGARGLHLAPSTQPEMQIPRSARDDRGVLGMTGGRSRSADSSGMEGAPSSAPAGARRDSIRRWLMDEQVPVDDSALADEIRTDGVHEVSRDLAYQRLGIVNVVYY